MEGWEMFIDFCLIAGMSFLALVVFFLLKSKAAFSKKLLIVFFANAFFFLLYYYGYLHRSRPIGAVAVLFGNGTGFLLGPMVLFLLKSLLFGRQVVKPLLKNLIPFFVFFAVVNVPVSLNMMTGQLRPYHQWYLGIEPYTNLMENTYFLVYILLTYRLLKRIQKLSEQNFSALEKNNLQWYRYLLAGFMVIIVADSLCTVYEMYFDMVPWNIGTIIAFIFIGLYLFLGYKGMFQSQILMPDFLLDKINGSQVKETTGEPVEESHSPEKTSRHIHFKPDEVAAMEQQLFSLLEKDKVYLNDELSLTELSDQMGISNKKLSELLNRHLNTTFYDLVNDYRIKEVKKRLNAGDAEKFTVISIAYDSGFQSKASFYRIFKQKEGVSPSDYYKKRVE